MPISELLARLQNPDLQCFTCVRMALRALANNDVNQAMTHLSIDADKLRGEDPELYQYVCVWRQEQSNDSV